MGGTSVCCYLLLDRHAVDADRSRPSAEELERGADMKLIEEERNYKKRERKKKKKKTPKGYESRTVVLLKRELADRGRRERRRR